MSIFSGRHYTWLSNELRYIYQHTPRSQKPGVEMTIYQIAIALGRESRGFDRSFFLDNCGIIHHSAEDATAELKSS